MKNQLDIKSYLTYFKNCIKKLVITAFNDKIIVYSAQACYFVIVSVIPFLCLTISIVSFLIPADIYEVFDSYKMPPEIKDLVNIVIEQLLATQNVSLLSISAIVALWTASRGCDAIRAGIENALVFGDIDIEPYKKQKVEVDAYGIEKRIPDFQKMECCEDICSLDDERLKDVFVNLKSVIDTLLTLFVE